MQVATNQGLCTNVELFRSRISAPHKQRQNRAIGVIFPHWVSENGFLMSFPGGDRLTGATAEKDCKAPAKLLLVVYGLCSFIKRCHLALSLSKASLLEDKPLKHIYVN